ncbi:MAG TPA: TaqI-like C-terminal specificity domain-containing protein, partial [Syntrophorhabdus sp.]|nr:TaqI-like C-terminal specificity domain-containing protein [Syntrophorhabdus sp.]
SEAKARSLFAKTYPAIHRHLSLHEDKLRIRDDQGKFWWELRSCVYWEEFEKPKLMYAEISTEGKFLFEADGYYSDTTTYIMASDSEYLLGVLNSKLLTFMFSKTSSEISGGFFRWKRQYMEHLPIFPATTPQKPPITERVRKILADPDSPATPRLESEIDDLVYKLYGLTKDEIALVEGQ